MLRHVLQKHIIYNLNIHKTNTISYLILKQVTIIIISI